MYPSTGKNSMMAIILNFAKTRLTLTWLFVQFAFYFCGVCECQTNGDVGLVGGLVPLEGRVEVYYDGQWGTVCDDFWDDEDATVVCRQLGYYNNGTAVLQSAFGGGNGPIYMDKMQYDGAEYEFQNCDYSGWGTNNCDHTEDASVACNLVDDEQEDFHLLLVITSSAMCALLLVVLALLVCLAICVRQMDFP